MEITTDLIFEGREVIAFIGEDKETGLIDIVCDSNGHEFVFSFEPECLENFVNALNEFQKNGKYKSIYDNQPGRIKPDHISLAMDNDKRVSMEVVLEEIKECHPYLAISSKPSKFNIHFNAAQAKEIKSMMEKIIEIKEKTKALEKKKTVKAEEGA